MRGILLTITTTIFLLSIYVGLIANSDSNNAQQKELVIEKNKPTVYLSFERYGTYQSPCGEPEGSGIWLRLNNNTKSAIFVDGALVKENQTDLTLLKLSDGSDARAVKSGTEMRLRYDWEGVSVSQTKTNKDGSVTLFSPVEVPLPAQSKLCSQKWMGGDAGRKRGFGIAPGNSVLFSVPKDFLTDKLKVNVEYSYEWEGADGFVKNFEPHHLVYFYGAHLPASNESIKKDSGQ